MDAYTEPMFGFPQSDNVENIEMYRRGGFHPLHIGDILNEKYTVIHKLGFGGTSTVWLARDQNHKLVAIKVSVAGETTEGVIDCETEGLKSLKVAIKLSSIQGHAKDLIDLPIEHFQISGPNGTHVCVVSRVAGPSIAQLTRAEKGLNGSQAQKAALQVTQCLALMHSGRVGIGHGDLTSANILLDVTNLEAWTEEQVYERLGRPEKELVRTFKGTPPPNSAPQYLVEPVDLTQLDPKYLTGNIRLIDFGESFFLADGPPSHRGTVRHFCSPEALLKDTFGLESDIWALGCVIFEMRSRGMLIEPGFGSPGEVLSDMTELLGAFPQELDRLAGNEGEENLDGLLLRDRIHLIEEKTPYDDNTGHRGFSTGGRTKTKSSCYLDPFRCLRMLQDYIKRRSVSANKLGKARAVDNSPATILTQEAQCLYDLLSRMFDYDVKKRITAAEMLGHPWFSMNFNGMGVSL